MPLGDPPPRGESEIVLLLEEWEALCLVDYAGMEQAKAALSIGF